MAGGRPPGAARRRTRRRHARSPEFYGDPATFRRPRVFCTDDGQPGSTATFSSALRRAASRTSRVRTPPAADAGEGCRPGPRGRGSAFPVRAGELGVERGVIALLRGHTRAAGGYRQGSPAGTSIPTWQAPGPGGGLLPGPVRSVRSRSPEPCQIAGRFRRPCSVPATSCRAVTSRRAARNSSISAGRRWSNLTAPFSQKTSAPQPGFRLSSTWPRQSRRRPGPSPPALLSILRGRRELPKPPKTCGEPAAIRRARVFHIATQEPAAAAPRSRIWLYDKPSV